MWRPFYISAVLSLMTSFAVANPPSTPASRPTPARWQNLLQRLGDADFATRDAAQKELDQVTSHDLDALRSLLQSASDPEVKARLAGRVAAIDENLAINPPGLTLKFKDANIKVLAEQLTKATGVQFGIFSVNESLPPGTFSLSVQEKPFWEVFLDLSRQQGLAMMDRGSTVQLYSQFQSGPGWRHGFVDGPLAVFPENITRQRGVFLQALPGPQLADEWMAFYCAVVADPRLHVLKYSQPVFTSIVDDAGNNLLIPEGVNGAWEDAAGRGFICLTAQAHLKIPEKRGTRIVSAKGSVRLLLQTAEEHVDVPEADRKQGQSFKIGGTTVKITRIGTQNDNTDMELSYDRYIERGSEPIITGILSDAAGKTIVTGFLPRVGSVRVSGAFPTPFQLRLSVPSKTKEITYSFDLKDLPLP
jgi:hypothetical protein